MQSRGDHQILCGMKDTNSSVSPLPLGPDMESWLEDIDSLLTPLSPIPSPPPPDPSKPDLSLLDDLEHLLGPWRGGTEKVQQSPCILSLDDLERLLEDRPENPGQSLDQREFHGVSPGIPAGNSTELPGNGSGESRPPPSPAHRTRRGVGGKRRREDGEVEMEGRAEELERENQRLRARIEELARQVQETRKLLIERVVNSS